jgi:alkanesulfonate monooxygenase SsuD/methylene tetrahydromethanopterin reductase-like flavin-dependent oxidoreductase (luciferase family)
MMHLGLSLAPFGHDPAAWRRADASRRMLDVQQVVAQVKKAAEGALDFVFFADALAHRPRADLSPQIIPFEPTTLVAAVATLVGRIGFVATAATGQHELYNLARRFASLDLISGGRAAWNWVASDHPQSWEAEYLQVVSALWDSWDPDAFLYDKSAGRFFAPDKMHVLGHRGEHFTVRGPLNVNRSPQGKPVIAHVLTGRTMEVAARRAEVVMLADAGLGARFLRLLAAAGRDRSEVRILANVVPWIGRTAGEATDDVGELAAADRLQGRDLPGTPLQIADAMQAIYEGGEVDGFLVMPPVIPAGLEAFVAFVVPELRRRGLFRPRYEGTTLREHLGLGRP